MSDERVDRTQEDGLDESDAALVARLKGAMAQGRFEVGMDGDQGGPDADGGSDAAGEGSYGSDFASAMNAYRAAREAGDREAMAAAERRLREVTRNDLAEFERRQGRSSIPHQDLHGRW